jgi:hypothetical protein
MFSSEIKNTTNPFVVMCSVIGLFVVSSAALIVDFIR